MTRQLSSPSVAIVSGHMRSVTLAVLTSCLSVASGLITNVLVYRALVRAVGVDSFGAFTLMLSLVGYLGLLEMGLNYGAARFLAAAYAKGNEDDFHGIITTTLWVNLLLMGLVVALGFITFAAFELLPGQFALLKGQREVWFIIVAWQASLFPFRTFTAALIGLQRQWEVNIIGAITTLVASAIALVIIHLGAGLAALPLANLIAGLGGGALTIVRVGWTQLLRAIRGRADWSLLLEMMSFNVYATLGGLLWGLQGTLDQWVSASAMGTAAAATVFLLYRFPLLGAAFLYRACESASPAMTSLIAQGQTARVREALHRFFDTSLAGLLLIGTMWAALGENVLRLWMGSTVSADRTTIALFGFAAVANVPTQVIFNGWLGLGDIRGFTLSRLAQLAAKVVLLLALIRPLGVAAVPLSMLASTLPMLLWEARRLSRLGILDYRRVLASMLRCGVFGAGAAILVRVASISQLQPVTPFLQLVTTTLVVGVPVVLGVYFGMVPASLRGQAQQALGKGWRRRRPRVGPELTEA